MSTGAALTGLSGLQEIQAMRLGCEGVWEELEGLVYRAFGEQKWWGVMMQCRYMTHRHKGLRFGFIQLELKLLLIVVDSVQSLGPGLRYSALEF